ncbi:hypothetical protein M409DRAFT_25286 [Zasmidium cellare ATCC 36951]|uniref:Zn(2)-C6 fungal-type domain-containing protein n=1 Tax=Zasmidium cellare ATCC 36951 TaxID=1080233 RepID=A0A6A6CFF8_ZASCE|nr:uncharacterized protein M409DRAFT_25286 [Zasmidium cellare ATCC 36951]KAF2164409.1 hypothetical protein M409DRAFT_25286 [Zasmidium cellare ATCC 36951]
MPADPSTRRRKQKAAVACDFCRRRKLGCDSGKPCNKCTQFGRDCVYSERPAKERPTNSRIAHLAQQNEELRTSLSLLQTPPTPDSSSGLQDQFIAEPAAVFRQTPFHGPSSALFDRHGPVHGQQSASLATSHERDHLLARASTQRQLETMHVDGGILAYGDVEPELCIRLLSAFWSRQHYTGTVVYRPTFMRDMACYGPYFTPLLLNAMLFIASKHSPRTLSLDQASDFCEGGPVFRRKAEEMLYDKETQILCKSRVTTIQALLLISDALFSWCDERSLSWHYLGIAINMIVDLGLHTVRSDFYRSGSVESGEVGRRLFWAAFIADKVQSIYQGRQCRLRVADSNVPISFLDEYEELEPFNTVTFAAIATQTCIPTRAVTTFEQTCKLSVIAESILSTLYAEKASSTGVEELLGAARGLHGDLERWKASLPSHLNLDWNNLRWFNVLPHTLALMAMYQSLSILLHRPFVSGGHIGNVSDPSVDSAFSTSMKAAKEIDKILRLYVEHFCVKSCPYFLSYATYVSATIHVRLAAQHATGSRAHQSLRFCLEVLSEQQTRCHAPRQSMAILLGLMKRLNVDVGKTFVAAKPRSEGMEGCQVDYPLEGTGRDDFLGNNQNLTTDTMLSLDDDLADYDLDAIMKTFDFSPQGLLSTDDCDPETSLLSANQHENQRGNNVIHSTSMLVADECLQNSLNGPFTFDPLFGLDAPNFDANASFI